MKKLRIVFVLMLFSESSAWAQDNITGVWLTEDQKSKVEVYEADGKYHGKIVWLENPNAKDKKNPEKKLRDRAVMGINILQDFTYEDGQWAGQVYSPRRGATLDAELSLDGNNQLIVTASRWGITKEQTWKRTTR